MAEPLLTGWKCPHLDLLVLQLDGRSAVLVCNACKTPAEQRAGPAIDAAWACPGCGTKAVVTQPPHGTTLIYCPECRTVPAIRPNVPLTELPKGLP
jgi:DNA-directed RNA polymerase subunit RPC12/RpoP